VRADGPNFWPDARSGGSLSAAPHEESMQRASPAATVVRPYRQLAVRVIDRALRDAADPGQSTTDRESARAFLAGSSMLHLWCEVAELDPRWMMARASRLVGGLELYRRQETVMSVKGTIKRLVSGKGFGFVEGEDGHEYFFHQSACADTRFDDLQEGQAVVFEKGQGPKGPRAENVRLA
jgi:CspA family cold shock protein